MPWPNKLASKITAQFFHWEYGDSSLRLLLDNPQVNEMNFFNTDASPEAQGLTAHLVASQLLKHMDGLNLDLEKDGNWNDALAELIEVLKEGDKESAEVAKIIDKHFNEMIRIECPYCKTIYPAKKIACPTCKANTKNILFPEIPI